MKTTNENNLQVGHDEIAQRAKQIWENEGRQAGRDLEYWLRAERELSGRSRTSSNRRSVETPVTAPPLETSRASKAPASAARIVHI